MGSSYRVVMCTADGADVVSVALPTEQAAWDWAAQHSAQLGEDGVDVLLEAWSDEQCRAAGVL